MTQEEYHAFWHDPQRIRALIDDQFEETPELFPQGCSQGYSLHGCGRESRKLPGMRLRKIVLASGESYWLRPSFVTCYLTGTVEELAYPLLLATHGVPVWLLTIGFGHNDMYRYRLIERLGRSSLVGTTVQIGSRLPEHLTADEHHVDWAGQKGYVATTVGHDCILGLALTPAADDAHLQQAYGVFAREARNLNPDYAPQTVNTDGWAPTQNAFQSLFSSIAVVLCFLHGFLKIRDRCHKAHDLHRRIWDVYRALTADQFRRLMVQLQDWASTQTWTGAVPAMLGKLANNTAAYAVAYEHPDCHRTSNAVDRPMNRLRRLLYAGRGLHGHQSSSERRVRGWALLLNFRPYAPRSRHPRPYDSPAHRLNGQRYHAHWLHNLLVSTSLMGHRIQVHRGFMRAGLRNVEMPV